MEAASVLSRAPTGASRTGAGPVSTWACWSIAASGVAYSPGKAPPAVSGSAYNRQYVVGC